MSAFRYRGKVYTYFSAPYNGTRLNERAVEVPIAMGYLHQSLRVLEVGAVLPHYLPLWPSLAHTCVDLHEQFPGVTNADVLAYEPECDFDLIICISTLDHLQSADEAKTAVSRMKSWLAPNGRLFATVPANQPSEIGGGPWLDALVLSGELNLTVGRMDKVKPTIHEWQERPLTEQPPLPYGNPNANTVYFLEYVNE